MDERGARVMITQGVLGRGWGGGWIGGRCWPRVWCLPLVVVRVAHCHRHLLLFATLEWRSGMKAVLVIPGRELPNPCGSALGRVSATPYGGRALHRFSSQEAEMTLNASLRTYAREAFSLLREHREPNRTPNLEPSTCTTIIESRFRTDLPWVHHNTRKTRVVQALGCPPNVLTQSNKSPQDMSTSRTSTSTISRARYGSEVFQRRCSTMHY